MKLRSGLLAFLLVILIPLVVHAGPKLSITQNKIILNDPYPAGSMATATFCVSNEGDSELVIQSVTPG